MMSKPLMLFVSLILVAACGKREKALNTVDTNTASKPSVALLGTFHFGETTDYSSMDMDNFNSQKRQKEMEELVRALQAFKPTKILLECTANDAVLFQKAYTNYREKQGELGMDEREQIGFRLAYELNLSTVHCIDFKLPLPMDSLSRFAEKHMKREFLDFLESIETNDKKDSKILAGSSLKQYYAFKNSDEEDLKNKRQYIQETSKFVSDSNAIGIKFVSAWWRRNLHIMSNIDKHLNHGDRVLVLIGGAHRAVLKDFFQDRNDVNYLEIRDYLL